MTEHRPITNTPHTARLRVQDFVLLNESGAFADYTKSELIEGEIWVVNAAYTRHARAQFRLARAIANSLDEAQSNLEVLTAASTILSDESMPEPDIVVAERHDSGPMPLEKVRLIVEISDSTLESDLVRKAPLYAKHGIAEYWVADMEGARIVQHWQADAEGYGRRLETPFGKRVEAATLPGLAVETGGLG